MEFPWENLADYLWQQSWQVAVLIVIVALINRALRQRSAHIRYLVWLIVLAKCLAPPVWQMSIPVFTSASTEVAILDASAPLVGQADQPAFAPGLANQVAEAPAGTLTDKALSAIREHWLLVIWGIVALGFYTCCLARMICMRRHLLKHRMAAPKQIRGDVATISERCGLTKSPSVWLIEVTDQPFVLGWLKGAVYLPTSFSDIGNAAHRHAVLAHELSHIRRYDAGINLLQIIAQGLFWFHPALWWANAQMRKEREKCCDEMALAHTATDTRAYCTALVNMLRSRVTGALPLGSVAVSGSVKTIEERIKTIMKRQSFKTKPSPLTTACTVLVAMILASTSCNLCEKQSEKAASALGASIDSKEKVLIDARIISFPADSEEIGEFLERENIRPIDQKITIGLSQIDVIKRPSNDNEEGALSLQQQIRPSKQVSASMHVLTTRQLETFESLPQAKVVAHPQVLTYEGKTAEIATITEEPILLEQGTPNETLRYIECGTKLRFTPQISHGKAPIAMDMAFEINELISAEYEEFPSLMVWKAAGTVTVGQGQGVLIPIVDSHKGSSNYALVTASCPSENL